MREKNAPRPWVIVNNAPDFAVIRRRTNTFVGACTISVANWSVRHGSPNDGVALVIEQISERQRGRKREGETRGDGGGGGGGGGDRIRLGVDVSGNFFLLRARDKKEEKERHAETRSDDGWPLEFQRAGNHAEASVYRPLLRNFCLQVGERRARAPITINSNNCEYRRNFDRITGFYNP